jgi:hypothetical protein
MQEEEKLLHISYEAAQLAETIFKNIVNHQSKMKYEGHECAYQISLIICSLIGAFSEILMRDSVPLEERLEVINKTIFEHSIGMIKDFNQFKDSHSKNKLH